MTLDALCLPLARLDETRIRRAATVHDEPQPEELVEHADDDRERDEPSDHDFQNRSNHVAYRLLPTAYYRALTAYCVLRAATCLRPMA